MVMTRPPAYHPGNFLMKNMNPTNSGLIVVYSYNCTSLYYVLLIIDRHAERCSYRGV